MQTDNPPAFPLQASDGDDMNAPEYGMSLRDWFAGQVLAVVVADIAQERNEGEPSEMPRLAAKGAYLYADAMLAARAALASPMNTSAKLLAAQRRSNPMPQPTEQREGAWPKGPYRVHVEPASGFIGSAPSTFVCQTGDWPESQLARVNVQDGLNEQAGIALLFAAAPELFEALVGMVDGDSTRDIDERYENALAALNKALGK